MKCRKLFCSKPRKDNDIFLKNISEEHINSSNYCVDHACGKCNEYVKEKEDYCNKCICMCGTGESFFTNGSERIKYTCRNPCEISRSFNFSI